MKTALNIIIFLFSLIVTSQNQTRDVLYLKNGSVIKGAITEMKPSTGIKIKTADGSLFIYKMDEILKTEKEEIVGKEMNNAKLYSTISNEEIYNYFSTFFENERPALILKEAKKTNGIKKEVFGQEMYVIEYELLIEIKKKIYPYLFVDANYNKGTFNYKEEMGYSGAKFLQKGEQIISKGSINYEKTDNGWRVKSYKNLNYNKVSSDYVSPQMSQQQAEVKAKQITELKSDLDWRSTDTEPAIYSNAYYSLENIPFFDNGNSRFSLQPMRSYKGRNDVAAKVQNTFYEALESTSRFIKTNQESYLQSANKAKYTFLITQVDFTFKETGYQCSIKVGGRAKGTFNKPNTYPFNYTLSLDAKSNGYKRNMSKAQALSDALGDFRGAVRRMIFKYNPTQLTFSKIITTKKGKVDAVIFKKPKQFVSTSKLKFILMKPNDLLVEDGELRVKGKIGDCIFKGEIVGDEIICDVSGGKNKKAIAKYIDTTEKLIGISSF